ncbi:hypothetical protein T08_4854 [Trichinella sp. T8]|nr:hypothetical protein T08_4854 [Trichinella sp. T8]
MRSWGFENTLLITVFGRSIHLDNIFIQNVFIYSSRSADEMERERKLLQHKLVFSHSAAC